MEKGDIFNWRWLDDKKDKDCGPFRSYHCKSQIAVFNGKSLIDTFWGRSPTDGSYLNPDKIKLTFRGNENNMTVLHDNSEYYSEEDLVRMAHSNSSNEPTYLKRGCGRDIEVMRSLAAEKIRDEESNIRSSKSNIKRLRLDLEKLERGEYQKIYM